MTVQFQLVAVQFKLVAASQFDDGFFFFFVAVQIDWSVELRAGSIGDDTNSLVAASAAQFNLVAVLLNW